MTTRRQRKLEETQPTLGEDSSSDTDTEYQTVPENSEEERQLLSAENDTVGVASTTNEDDDIIIDEVNIAVSCYKGTGSKCQQRETSFGTMAKCSGGRGHGTSGDVRKDKLQRVSFLANKGGRY